MHLVRCDFETISWVCGSLDPNPESGIETSGNGIASRERSLDC